MKNSGNRCNCNFSHTLCTVFLVEVASWAGGGRPPLPPDRILSPWRVSSASCGHSLIRQTLLLQISHWTPNWGQGGAQPCVRRTGGDPAQGLSWANLRTGDKTPSLKITKKNICFGRGRQAPDPGSPEADDAAEVPSREQRAQFGAVCVHTWSP